MHFYKAINRKTFTKYFLSYFLIFSILVLGFLFIIKASFSKHYSEQLSKISYTQLNNLSTELTNDMSFLSQLYSSIASNVEIIASRYDSAGFKTYAAQKELIKYEVSNELINAICFFNKQTDTIITTQHTVLWRNSTFQIVKGDSVLTFDPEPYLDTSKNHLFFLSNETMHHLIFFPAQSSNRKYITFFFIDETELRQRLKNMCSIDIPAIALIDQNMQIIVGVNSAQLNPVLGTFELENGIYKSDSSASICVSRIGTTDFSIISLISDNSLRQQLNNALVECYLILFVLCCISFFMILIAMKTTYMPLQKLVKKIIPTSNARNDYLSDLDTAFNKLTSEKNLSDKKLQKYQLSVKKSLFDAVLHSAYSDIQADLPDIDLLFDFETTKVLYVIKIHFSEKLISYLDIRKYLEKSLSEDDSCILLKKDTNHILFLIIHTDTSTDTETVLLETLHGLYQKHHCFSALSNSATSPMSLPSLCENVSFASRYWSTIPVVNFNLLPPIHKTFSYPQEHIDELLKMLNASHFSEAKMTVDTILKIVDNSTVVENPMPDFFIRSILIDLLTTIGTYMILAKINSNTYNNIYYDTLYFCRSCPYSENKHTIAANIQELLEICEQEADVHITAMQIRQLIEESCYDPNFSIYSIADKLHISFSHASNLVKKELGQNFSDYVWTLRFEKAKDLLTQTDMTVNEISIAIGYTSTSSFIRKFKSETKITPTEFRRKNAAD